LIFPSYIDAEVAAIQDIVNYALNRYALRIKEEVKGKSTNVVREVVEFAEKVDPLRITGCYYSSCITFED
jgi:hypothetical protein